MSLWFDIAILTIFEIFWWSGDNPVLMMGRKQRSLEEEQGVENSETNGSSILPQSLRRWWSEYSWKISSLLLSFTDLQKNPTQFMQTFWLAWIVFLMSVYVSHTSRHPLWSVLLLLLSVSSSVWHDFGKLARKHRILHLQYTLSYTQLNKLM